MSVMSLVRHFATLAAVVTLTAGSAYAQKAPAKAAAPATKAAETKAAGTKAATKAPEAAPAAEKKTHRLPAYYAGVVDDAQRDKIYGLQDQYDSGIKALQDQLDSLTDKRDHDIEMVLTPAQREQVAKAKAEARDKRTKAEPAAADTKADAKADAKTEAPAKAAAKAEAPKVDAKVPAKKK